MRSSDGDSWRSLGRILGPVLLALPVLWACSRDAAAPRGDPEPRVHVVAVGTSAATELAAGQGSAVRGALRRMLESCSVDSIALPEVFDESAEAAWARVGARARIDVALAVPEEFTWLQGRAAFRELRLELASGHYPGVLLGRGPQAVVQLTKCSGLIVVELGCLPELKAHVPASYREQCHLLDAPAP